jgi:hypothetical protein
MQQKLGMETKPMNAKEYLSQAFKLDQRINSKLEQVASLQDLAAKVTASYTTDRVDGTKQRSPMENAIVKLVDLEYEIDADIDRLVDLKRELSTFIMQVPNSTFRLLLELRYLVGNTWEDVSKTMEYDLRWIYRLHGRALQEADILLSNKPLKDTQSCGNI